MQEKKNEGMKELNFINIKLGNASKRALLGALMLPAFILLCSCNKVYLYVFNVLLVIGVSYELISITQHDEKVPALPLPLVIYLYVIISLTGISSILKTASSEFAIYYKAIIKLSILFYGYVVGLIWFVACLKKSKLKTQLLLFMAVHMIAYIGGKTCKFAIHNINNGVFYYFYPCMLIISNDIFAYFIGKTLGKTPLYMLSPNKTVEGYVGALFCTNLVGALLVFLKLKFRLSPDMYDSIMHKNASETIPLLRFPMLYIHNFAFSMFASIAAPFIGFIASAIKRAYKKKDFGHIIPGHGGITDRMDCQFMMVYFTYFYLNAVTDIRKHSIEQLVSDITQNYSGNEIVELIFLLANKHKILLNKNMHVLNTSLDLNKTDSAN
ncbi:phosphatidate cytidylyltransferase [Enteropsectra breve]|nr:phosphatidate cytidylyltransferase [Enteropsectra breve]